MLKTTYFKNSSNSRVQEDELKNEQIESDVTEVGEPQSSIMPGKNKISCMDHITCVYNDSSSDLLYCNIIMEDINIKAVVDTGATHSLINDSVAEMLRLDRICSHNSLSVIGGKMNTQHSCKSNVHIAGVKMLSHNFLIIPAGKMTYSIVLGADFMRSNKLCVLPAERKIIKKVTEDSKIVFHIDKCGTVEKLLNNISLVADEDVMMGVGCSVKVPITVSHVANSGEKMLLYTDEGIVNPLLDKARGLSGICDASQKYIIMIASENTTVKKGQRVGSISSIIETEDQEVIEEGEIFDGDRIENEIELPCYLTKKQKEDVYNVLKTCQGVISKGNDDIGRASVTDHKIRLYDDTPIYQRPRRFTGPVADEIERQCQELNALDIIEPSVSPFSSPIVPIIKKDGSLRMCIDYRKLNNVTIKDKFPVPNVIDSIFGLKGNKYFTSLDLVRGYYQVPLDEQSKQYTAFSTVRNHWQFKRLSFGLTNAPSAFQREIQAVLSSFPSTKVIVYIDDILILGKSFEEHLQLVNKVLKTLESYHMKIKPSKCQFFQKEVQFLGHLVSEEGIRKTPEYVEKIENYPRPTNVGELREFLGLINFQRKFLPNCSEVQKPLSCLTGGKKKKQLEWSTEMINSFETLKREMKKEINLAYPDYGEEANDLQLWVDASNLGAGCYLAQEQDGVHRVIGFASMTFSSTQLNYSTLERELTALRWGVKTFKPFLFGVRFVLFTDHQPLIHLHNMKIVCSRIARTLQELSEFDFEIRYTPGHLNTAADTLSRVGAPASHSEDKILEGVPGGFRVDGPLAPGGADSLFFSLHKVASRLGLKDFPKDSSHLRKVIVEELLRNSKRYNINLTRETRKQLRLMFYDGQLPSLELLLPASRLLECRIGVYFWNTQPVFYQAGTFSNTVYIQCIGGIHFNPLLSVENQCSLTKGDSLESFEKHIESDERITESKNNYNKDSECRHLNTNCVHPVIEVKTHNKQWCAMIDTGAQISLISQAVIECFDTSMISIDCNIKPFEIVGITGKKIEVRSMIELVLDVGINKFIEPHKFFIVPENSFPYCFLLGIDLLNTNHVYIDFNDNTCNFRGCTVKLNMCFVPTEVAVGVLMARPVQRGHECSHQLVIGNDDNDLRLTVLGNDSEISGLELLLEDGNLNELQERNTDLKTLKRYIKNKTPLQSWKKKYDIFKRYVDRLSEVNDVLMYREKEMVVVVSFKMMVELGLILHYKFCHIGRDKLVELVKRLVWHPKRYKIISDICITCPECQVSKVSSKTMNPPILKIHSSTPFELVAVDLISLPKTRTGYVGCLTLVDHYSKWVAAVPIRNKTSQIVAHALVDRIIPFMMKVPEKLLSDNGPEFASEHFRRAVLDMGTKQIFSTPYNPSSNGAIERVNRTIQGFLRSLVNYDSDWDVKLSQCLIAYNNTYHREIKMSPIEFLMTKDHIKTRVPLIDSKNLSEVWKMGSNNFDSFAVHDYVLKKVPSVGNLTSNKFRDKYNGPFKVIRVNSNTVSYLLLDESNGREIRAHHNDLTLYRKPPAYISNNIIFRELIGDEVSYNVRDERSLGTKRSCLLLMNETDSDDEDECESNDDEPLNNGAVPERCTLCDYEDKRKNCDFRLISDPASNNARENNEEFWEVSAPGVDTALSANNTTAESTVNSSNKTITALETFIDGACSALGKINNTILNSVNHVKDFTVNDIVSSTPIDETRRCTRSSGPVPSYSNVQSHILERKRNVNR